MFESNTNQEYIDELIACFLSKGTNPEEEKELLAWTEMNTLHREYYKQMYHVWLSSAQSGRMEPHREEQALKQVHKKAFENSIVERRRQSKKNVLSVFKYAATIAFLIVGTYLFTRYFTTLHLESQIAEMTYEAHYGSRAYTVLSDGTKVWLNSGSKLTVLSGYNFIERTVELSGEAYFDVETNLQKPFIVKAGEICIKATGTTFNVKAYPEEEQITTTLVEGIVFIEGTDNYEKSFKLQMKPNQIVNIMRQHPTANNGITSKDTIAHLQPLKPEKQDSPISPISAKISPVKTETLTSWMRDRWVIDNEEFGHLSVQLERRYNVEIRFESDELKQYRFTGTIERETVEQMFDAFRYSIPLKYTIDKGIITIFSDDKLKKQYEKAWKVQ